MKGRFLASGALTLILIASITGIYLLISFKSEEPWLRMLILLRENIVLGLLIIIFSLHLFFKAIYTVLRFKKRRVASALILLSLALIFVSIYLSLFLRDTERYKMNVQDKTGNGQNLLRINMELAEKVVVVDENNKFSIDMVEAIMDDNGREVTLRPFPFVRTSSGYAYINNAGLSPDINVWVDDLLPPGKEESLILIGDYQLGVSFAVNRYTDSGNAGLRLYSLDKPGYRVALKKSGDVILEGVLHDNEGVKGEGVWIEIGETIEWVEIVYVRDGALPVLYIGLICLLSGILIYPLELYYKIHG